MAIREVLKMGDPRLLEQARPVEDFASPELARLLGDMHDTMRALDGAGLAAPQIGVGLQVVIFEVNGNPRYPDVEPVPFTVLINPVLTLSGEEVVSEQEGCLSVPMNYRADVKRMSKVHLSAKDLDGNVIEEDLEEFPAIVIQHEFDHLDGVLFIDRISRLRRSLYDSKVKKWLKKKTAE